MRACVKNKIKKKQVDSFGCIQGTGKLWTPSLASSSPLSLSHRCNIFLLLRRKHVFVSEIQQVLKAKALTLVLSHILMTCSAASELALLLPLTYYTQLYSLLKKKERKEKSLFIHWSSRKKFISKRQCYIFIQSPVKESSIFSEVSFALRFCLPLSNNTPTPLHI